MLTTSQPGTEMAPLPKNLHQLVNIAAGHSLITAVQRNSFIVNEVSREFQIAADEIMLANVLNTLVSTVARHSADSCIRIKAKEYDDIIFVSVKDQSGFNKYDMNGNLEQVQLLAKKINGNISIGEPADSFTTILLTFPNFPKAA